MFSIDTPDRLATRILGGVERENKWMVLVAVLVGGYVLFVPSFSVAPTLGSYNEKRTVEIGLLILVGSVLLSRRSVRQQWLSSIQALPRTARLGLCGVLSLGLLSSALAPAPFYAFLEVGHFVLLFAAAGGVATLVHLAPKWVNLSLLGVVVVSVILYTVHFAVGYSMHLAMADVRLWPKGGSNFANIRFFNQYQTWTLPLLTGAVLAIPRQWRIAKGFMLGLSSLWWTLVFASSGQGTMVAVAGATVCIGLLFGNRAIKWLGLQATAALVGWILFKLMFSIEAGSGPTNVSPLGQQLSGESDYPRLDHWATCLDMLGAHPWLGAGPMHYAWPPFNFEPAASPHSAFFQWLGEWGVPSTAVMSSLTVWGGWSLIRQEQETARVDEEGNVIGIALVASLLAGAAHSMISGIIVTPLSQVLLVFVGGWAWGRHRHETHPISSSLWLRHIAWCALLAASMAVVGGNLSDLSTVKERRSAFLEAAERNMLSPRYWTQGYIGIRKPNVIKRARLEHQSVDGLSLNE